MRYVLATVEVPDEQQQYYAGPIRQIAGRMAHKVTLSPGHATSFDALEEAEAMCKELGGQYHVVAVDAAAT